MKVTTGTGEKLYRTTAAVCMLLILVSAGAAAEPVGAAVYSDPPVMEKAISADENRASVEGAQQYKNMTDAQKKISTDLLQLLDSRFLPETMTRSELLAQMEQLDQVVPAGVSGSEAGIQATDNLVYVYVRVGPDASTGSIDPYVTLVTDRDEPNHLAVAWVEVGRLEQLAALDAVRTIRTVMPPVCNAGSVTTEGDWIHRADEVRAAYGISGSGIKVGIISDGVDNLASSQASGDLPADVHVLSNAVGGDEGTAMLEIVHDIAPGAELYFYDMGTNTIAFNSAIDALWCAGCTVICDDISWLGEPFFEDGIVAAYVDDLVASGNLIYVTSAGNAAQRHYQGLYYGDENFHDFSEGTSSVQDLYVRVPPGGSVRIVLQWNDKFGRSGNDYDLSLWDMSTSSQLGLSDSIQDGDDDPIEYIGYTNSGPQEKDVVIRVSNYLGAAAPKTLEVFIYPANGASVYADNIRPEDSIYGHAAAPNAITVGAIAADDPGSDTIEGFSSRGPATISYPVPTSRTKPDIAGIDGVSITGAGGFSNPFYGTSAAAPHIAGIAALTWSAFPTKFAGEIRSLLYGTAVDLGSAGKDTVFGHGRADALAMMATAAPLPKADFMVNTTEGYAPLAVRFSDASTGSPTSWRWTFGDDEQESVQNPVHVYAAPGNYTVGLAVTNGFGTNTTTKTHLITALRIPVPCISFSANRTSGDIPLAVQFTDLSTGSPTAWQWDFGDGEQSSVQNPIHVYTRPGNYSVRLNATNAGGSNSSVKSGYISALLPAPPDSNFTANVTTGTTPLTVRFTDTSTGDPTDWLWSFGDGGTSAEQHPVHTYTAAGDYTVNLKVTNAGGSDTLTRPGYIAVIAAVPLVTDPTATPGVIPTDTDGIPGWGETAGLSVTVTGTSIASVTVNLSAIGGPASAPMEDAGDGTWTANVTGTTPSPFEDGAYLPVHPSVNATGTDGLSNISVTIPLTVVKNGDANGDYKVTLYDAVHTARHTLGMEGYPMTESVGMVSGGDGLSLHDAMYLAKHVLAIPGFETLH